MIWQNRFSNMNVHYWVKGAYKWHRFSFMCSVLEMPRRSTIYLVNWPIWSRSIKIATTKMIRPQLLISRSSSAKSYWRPSQKSLWNHCLTFSPCNFQPFFRHSSRESGQWLTHWTPFIIWWPSKILETRWLSWAQPHSLSSIRSKWFFDSLGLERYFICSHWCPWGSSCSFSTTTSMR